MIDSKRMAALLLGFTFSSALVTPASAATRHVHFQRESSKRLPPLTVVDRFTTKNGRKVTLYAGNMALVQVPNGSQSVRYLPDLAMATHGLLRADRSLELAAVNKAPTPTHPFVDGEVLVVLRSGTGLPDTLSFSNADLAAKRTYAGDSALNTVFRTLGVNHVRRFLTGLGEARLAAMRARARGGAELLPLENAYAIQITRGTVRSALSRLHTVTSVLDAEPVLRVNPMHTYPIRLGKAQLTQANSLARSGHDRLFASHMGKLAVNESAIPGNYAVAYSAQSALNAPGVNAVAAYDEIERHFHQLPGTGEIITNVSVGDVTDSTTATDKSSPCYQYASGDGPTVALIGGQHYVEMPSLPAIPAYVANDEGQLSGSGVACGEDPDLTEVGLDFSVMSALPHQMQQSSELGAGYSDLLGIAPGASYRLVVPETTATFLPTIENGPTNMDLAGAILGAAAQSPAPNVITMSIGFGYDQYGFPSRYIEEDRLLQSAIEYAVGQGIVVCVAAGDGLRTYTNASVGPSGGTVPIDTVSSGQTNIFDDELSTTPSLVMDSGAIAVGGSTLDDVTSAPPDQAQFASFRDQLAFPQVRWNGFGSLASSYGTRVNISAPSDNILADSLLGTTFEGGTSASAPMVAAGAAVALQVARLTGKPFSNPQSVRAFLASTARPVPNVPQADMKLNVGPQLDVANEVETLLHESNTTMTPVLNRVAIAQRYPQSSEFVFSTDTDPTEIDMDDTYAMSPGQVGSSAFQPITIAPDWEELPAGTKFRLFLQNSPHKILGTGPWARLFPAGLLAATNQPFYSPQPRSVSLIYQAYLGFKVIASASVGLTFAPNKRDLQGVGPAPEVPPVETGTTIPVRYDISSVDPTALANPALIVSYPGRMSTWTSGYPGYKALYRVPITRLKGTIQVPVSALQGDGVYGIAVQINTWAGLVGGPYTVGLSGTAPIATTWAYTRVATVSAKRPAAPILMFQGDATFPAQSGHAIDVSYGAPFQLQWNVANVPGANGAILEISAAGPGLFGSYNTFNNPNGSELDNNGVDTGSVYHVALSGTSGTTTVNPWSSVVASQYYNLRVLPTIGGQVDGEAGDISTIVPHGIIPSDGGSIVGGFAINQNSDDGVLTSNQLDSTNHVDTSIQSFDLQSMRPISTIAAISTDAGADSVTGGGANVPIYNLSGFGTSTAGDAAFVGVDDTQWIQFSEQGSYFTGLTYSVPVASSLEYVPNLHSTYPFPTCELCVSLTSPTGYPFEGSASSPSSDYTIAYMSGQTTMGVTPVVHSGNSATFGTTVTMPNPQVTGSVFNFSLCNGFSVSGNTAFTASMGEDSGAIYLQSVNLSSGQAPASVPAPGEGTTCNLASLGNITALAVASGVAGGHGQSTLYLVTPTLRTPKQLLLPGYLPSTLSAFSGAQIGGGFAVVSALSLDYLTNANATSVLSIVPTFGSNSYSTPFGNYDDMVIPMNNRYAGYGSNGMLYLLGAGSYEIAPFPTGL